MNPPISNACFFRATDVASLAFFRIAFGVLALADVLNTWIYYHLKKNAFDPAAFQFHYYGFEWVRPWPEPVMSAFFISLLLAAAGIVLGRWYRVCTLYFAVGFAYTFLLEKAHYLNHGYLFCWLCFVMIFLPADRQFSWSVWKDPARRRDVMPFWCLFVLRFLIGVVYFFGGLAKINADWLRGVPLVEWMAYKASTEPLLGPVFGWPCTPYIMAYGGLLLDLTIVWFLLHRRTRPWAFALAVGFHGLNALIFNIGIFPYLSLALTALYFPAGFPRKIIAWWSARLRLIQRLASRWQRRVRAGLPNMGDIWQAAPGNRPYIRMVLTVFIIIHLVIPLRHHLIPGPVAWTEEGHRYSWRMMLRAKQGRGYFRVADQGGATEAVRPEAYLNDRQARKLYTHPDMILQFAHFLKDQYAANGREVAIFADIEVRLNDRPYRTYIDPAVDLGSREWHFLRHADWIMPLEADTVSDDTDDTGAGDFGD